MRKSVVHGRAAGVWARRWVAVSIGGLSVLLSSCAQDTYTLGDVNRGSVNAQRAPRDETTLRAKVEENRAAPEKGWKPSVANIPEQGQRASAPRQTAVLEMLNNKRVKVSSIDGLTIKQFAELYFNQLLGVQVSIDPSLQASKNKIFLLASSQIFIPFHAR